MGIYGSYSNFTTKGHGVIEGPSDPNYYGVFKDKNRRRRKIGTKYKRLGIKKVPENYTLVKTCDKVGEISPYIDKMISLTRSHFKIDLKKGFVVTIRGGLYIKQQNGKFLVYTNPNIKSSKDTGTSKHVNRKPKTTSYDDIYQNLLRIKKQGDKKRIDQNVDNL